MSKKFIACILSLMVALFSVSIYIYADGEKPQLTSSYILMEAQTHTVLSESNSDKVVPCGVMCKLMTVLLAADEISNGNLTLDEMITTSSNANSKQGAQIWLMPGEQMSVRDILKGIIIGNANDAATALAEKISCSEQKFVADMNARAFDLGMRDTAYYSPSGYDGNIHTSTAYDMALLCSELSKYEFLNEFMTTWLDYVRDGGTELVNENSLVRNYKGIIGFKASHSVDTGCCIAVGAKRDNITFISVALGYQNEDGSFSTAKSLLGTGFSSYQVTEPALLTEHMKPLEVKGGVDFAVEVTADELMSLVVPKGSADDIQTVVFLPKYITAPVSKGQSIGTAAFYVGDTMIYETDIVAADDVEEMDFGKAIKAVWLKLLK